MTQIGGTASACQGSVENIAFCGFEDTGDTLGYATEGGPDDANDAFGPTTSNPRSGQKSFEAQDTGGSSEYPDNIVFDQVDVSSYDNVWIHVWIDTNWGGFESSDYIRGYVSVDGGAWTEFFYIYDDTGSSSLPVDYMEYTYNVGDTASTVRIKIEMRNSANTEIYYFDDVSVTGSVGEAPPVEIIIDVTETAPTDLDNYNIENTWEVWLSLIENAENTIDIEAFYLIYYDWGPMDALYDAIFAAADRGVETRILVDSANYNEHIEWMQTLDNHENITVLPFTSEQQLHSKYMIVDDRVVSVGSTNWSYSAMVNNREVNVTLRGEEIAGSYTHIFEGGWSLAGGENRGSTYWEADWIYPVAHGLGVPENVAPTENTLLDMLDAAENTITVYVYYHTGSPPTLDNALRNAAARDVEVKLMIDKDCYLLFASYIKSLAEVQNVLVKVIDLTYAPPWIGGGVSHPKVVLVDDQWAYVGSANWTRVAMRERRETGVVFKSTDVVAILDGIFYTDWNSPYASWVRNPYSVAVEVFPTKDGGLPGENIELDIVVTNVGRLDDNYDLSASDVEGWQVSISPTTLSLGVGENESVTLTVSIPTGASAGKSDIVTVTATSQGDNEVSDNKSVLALVADVAQLSPVDDAAVFQDSPGSNYGSEAWLEVASSDNNNRRSLLKFDLSQLPENALTLDAELNLYFYYGSYFVALREAGVLIEAREILDDNWSESTVTWNNAPTLGDLLNAVEIGSYGWKVWDVSNFVAQQFENDNLASFAIKFDTEDFDETLRRIRFQSKEYSDNTQRRPYLKVKYFPASYSVEVEASPSQKYRPAGQEASYNIDVTNLGNIDDSYELSYESSLDWSIEISPSILENVFPSETKTATLTVTVPDNATLGTVNTVTITATSLTESTAEDNTQTMIKVVGVFEFSPIDDSYVSQASPNANYGDEPHLEVASMIGGNRRAYVKFDVSTVPENMGIISSRIYAYFYWGSGFVALRDNDVLIKARAVRNDNWSESTVTWNNAPEIEEVLESVQIGYSGNWKWWNINNYTLEQYGGDKLVSVALKFSVENFDESLRRIRFRSDEYSDNVELRPYLSVWYFPATYSVEVEASPSQKYSPAGQEASYNIDVTNLGNIDDSYELSYESSLDWSIEISPSILENVFPSETKTATLTVTVPDNATLGTVNTVTITATSLAEPTAEDNTQAITKVVEALEFSPTDDSYVSQASPGANYGNEPHLEVASMIGGNRRAYVKFDVSTVPENISIVSSRIYTYFYWGSGFVALRDNDVLIEARAVRNDNWSESTVTWNNAPAIEEVLESVQIGYSKNWKWWNIDNYTLEQLGGDKLVSAALKFSVENFDATLRRIRFRSDEYSDVELRPYLSVWYFPSNVIYDVNMQVEPEVKGGSAGENLQYTVKVTNLGTIKDSFDLSAQSAIGWNVSLDPNYLEKVQPNTTATATLTVTIPENAQAGEIDNITISVTSQGDNSVSDNAVVKAGIAYVTTLLPSADSYVDQANPNSNYGSATCLEIASKTNGNRRSFLKFDLSDILASQIIDAELNLYLYWGYNYVALRDAGVLIEAREVTDDSWSESTITWNNAPMAGEVIDASEIGSYGWKEWNIIDYVIEQFENESNQLASFAIKLDNEDFDNTLRRMRFHSEEYSVDTELRPYLEVKYFPVKEVSGTWTQTNWSGGGTYPTLQVDTWDNTYDNYYQGENIDTSDGENIKLALESLENIADHVVISEISVNGKEFVELYNPTSTSQSLNGWYWSYYSSTRDWNNPYRNKAFPSGASIAAYGYYLIAVGGSWNSGEYDWRPYTSNQLSNSNGSVAIFPFNPGNKTAAQARDGRIDAVAWGSVSHVKEGQEFSTPGSNQSQERKAQSSSTSNSMRNGDSSLGNGYDTENNANDFVFESTAQPQKSGTTETPPERGHLISSAYDAGQVVTWGVVEFDNTNPVGTDIDVYVRTSSDANNWSTWILVESGQNINQDNRYIQYKVELSTTDNSVAPTFCEIRIQYPA